MNYKYCNNSNYGNDIKLTKEQAEQGFHIGDCENDVIQLMQVPEIKKQLDKLDKENLKKELSEYGAWDEEELNNHEDNLKRWLWISCGDVVEDNFEDISERIQLQNCLKNTLGDPIRKVHLEMKINTLTNKGEK